MAFLRERHQNEFYDYWYHTLAHFLQKNVKFLNHEYQIRRLMVSHHKQVYLTSVWVCILWNLSKYQIEVTVYYGNN